MEKKTVQSNSAFGVLCSGFSSVFSCSNHKQINFWPLSSSTVLTSHSQVLNITFWTSTHLPFCPLLRQTVTRPTAASVLASQKSQKVPKGERGIHLTLPAAELPASAPISVSCHRVRANRGMRSATLYASRSLLWEELHGDLRTTAQPGWPHADIRAVCGGLL